MSRDFMKSDTIRSRLPLLQVIVIPYLVLLLLLVGVSGAGSVWLYFKARQAQSQLLVHGLLREVEPLVAHLAEEDGVEVIRDENSWLHRELENIFARLPDLENVSVHTEQAGFRKYHDQTRNLVTEKVAGGVAVAGQDLRRSTAARRLYSESAPLLRVEFLVTSPENESIRLEFGFNRATLRDAVGRAMSIMLQALTFFWGISIVCLLVSCGVTIWAAIRVRRLEAHMQELYRHASAAELMAGLVHDLRNPLASFRANLAALRITPEEHDQIVAEMDQDLVRLDAKLRSMLDLTKTRNEPRQDVDLEHLFASVERLARPSLEQRGLKLQTVVRLDQPVSLMADAMRDALLNLVLNSAESGQESGVIELEAWQEAKRLLIQVRDRGKGLPRNINIFAPFVTTKADGHGLGLAISRRIIEAHGGTIMAADREGGGTVVTIQLPLSPVGRRQ